MPAEHRGHAGMAAEALHEAAKAPYAADKQVAINLAQVHATLEVAHQLELIRTEGIRKRGHVDDMHYCDATGTGAGRIPTAGSREACPRCSKPPEGTKYDAPEA